MKLFSLLLVTVSMLGFSCERHDFEGPDGTKQLHQHHGHDDDAHHEDSSGGH